MLHFIDPTIDFVFKLILGTIGNENLLIDFINRIIKPISPIVSVTYINPVNDKFIGNEFEQLCWPEGGITGK
ncbi:MAG: hypothetical protein ACI8WB_005914 [Phenylobacterium sp.]|jgi:hypothetical protein